MTALGSGYVETVLRAFAALKRIDDERTLEQASLPLDGSPGRLVPVCRLHEHDADLIRLLAAWRVRNMHVYPTQFRVTFDGTAAWLRERVLDVPDRIMFLVRDGDGRWIGHGGIDNALADGASVRLDNVMRGVDDAPPGLMHDAVATLLGWVERAIGPKTVWLKVFSDNEPAIRFLRGLGFRDERLMPLRRVEHDGRISFEPDAEGQADRHHLRMVLTPSPQVRHP